MSEASQGDTAPAERSLTFAEVFAEDNAASESPTDEPSSEASSAEPSAAAPTSQPTPPKTDEQTRDSRGPIPYDRHQAVLTNARNEAQRALEAERAKYGWVQPYVERGLTQEQFEYLIQAGQTLGSDPVRFLNEVVGTDNPAIQQWAAQVLQASRRAEASGASDDAEPQPDLQTPDGLLVYSAQQQVKREAWVKRQLLAEVQGTIKPLVDERQQREQERAYQATVAKVTGEAEQTVNELKELPHFWENRKAILAEWQSHGGKLSLERAFLNVLKRDIFPTLSQTAQAKVVADMRKQAHAGSVNPKGAVPTESAEISSFRDARLKW